MTSQPKPSSVEPTRRAVVSLQPYLRPEDPKVLRKPPSARWASMCVSLRAATLFCLTYYINLFYYKTLSVSVFFLSVCSLFDKNASQVCLNTWTGIAGGGIFLFLFFFSVLLMNWNDDDERGETVRTFGRKENSEPGLVCTSKRHHKSKQGTGVIVVQMKPFLLMS